MTLRRIRIGAVSDAAQYDDADYDAAMETDQPIKAGDPIDSNDVVTLGVMGMTVKVVASITDPSAELNLLSSSAGRTIMAVKVNAAGVMDEYTIYAYDASGPAVGVPFVVDAAGVGSERWIAIGGKYSYIAQFINAELKVLLLKLLDTDQSHTLELRWDEDVAANRILFIDLNDDDRRLTLNASAALNQDVQTTDSPTFAGVTLTGKPDEIFNVLVAIQAGGAGPLGIQYTYKQVTVTKGIITALGATSGWNDI